MEMKPVINPEFFRRTVLKEKIRKIYVYTFAYSRLSEIISKLISIQRELEDYGYRDIFATIEKESDGSTVIYLSGFVLEELKDCIERITLSDEEREAFRFVKTPADLDAFLEKYNGRKN